MGYQTGSQVFGHSGLVKTSETLESLNAGNPVGSDAEARVGRAPTDTLDSIVDQLFETGGGSDTILVLIAEVLRKHKEISFRAYLGAYQASNHVRLGNMIYIEHDAVLAGASGENVVDGSCLEPSTMLSGGIFDPASSEILTQPFGSYPLPCILSIVA